MKHKSYFKGKTKTEICGTIKVNLTDLSPDASYSHKHCLGSRRRALKEALGPLTSMWLFGATNVNVAPSPVCSVTLLSFSSLTHNLSKQNVTIHDDLKT